MSYFKNQSSTALIIYTGSYTYYFRANDWLTVSTLVIEELMPSVATGSLVEVANRPVEGDEITPIFIQEVNSVEERLQRLEALHPEGV